MLDDVISFDAYKLPLSIVVFPLAIAPQLIPPQLIPLQLIPPQLIFPLESKLTL
jgi:hypothetical protein